MLRFAISLALLSCQPTPTPGPKPAPTHTVDAGSSPPLSSCDSLEGTLGARFVCVAFEAGKDPGAIQAQFETTCAAKGTDAALKQLAALDTAHSCNEGGVK